MSFERERDGLPSPSPGHASGGRPADETLPFLRSELGPELEVTRRIGRGSRASVYLAREPSLKRLVAVKVLDLDVAADEVSRRRFEREAQAAGSIAHPNVVPVHRLGRLSDGRDYLVLRFVDGCTLLERSHAEGPLPVEEVRRILASLADALDAAHTRGVVHRDVRPGNVLYEPATREVYLTDFGIAALLDTPERHAASLTAAGQLLGDCRYTSPEQLRGEKVDGQTDVYALGTLAYELLTGRGPYGARTPGEAVEAHLTAEPRPLLELRPDADPDLDNLLRRCLAKEPGDRPRPAVLARRLRGGAATVAGPAGAAGSAGDAVTAPPGAGEETAPREGDGRHPSGPLAELRERRVPHIAGSFAALGWLALQAVDQLVANGIVASTAYPMALILFLTGLPGSAAFAWFHGKPGPQRVRTVEVWVFGGLAFGALVAAAIVLAA